MKWVGGRWKIPGFKLEPAFKVVISIAQLRCRGEKLKATAALREIISILRSQFTLWRTVLIYEWTHKSKWDWRQQGVGSPLHCCQEPGTVLMQALAVCVAQRETRSGGRSWEQIMSRRTWLWKLSFKGGSLKIWENGYIIVMRKNCRKKSAQSHLSFFSLFTVLSIKLRALGLLSKCSTVTGDIPALGALRQGLFM